MYEKLHAIVLHVIKYSDKNSIVHLFTKERGRIPFLLRQGATKSARMRNAMFMPLSIIEIEANVMQSRDISTFREARLATPLHNLYTNPIKNAVAMFISELIGKVVQSNEENKLMYDYVESSILLLNELTAGEANFHICFLYHLGHFLGIQPDIGTYRRGYAFDMNEGIFTPNVMCSTHLLPPDEAKVLVLIDRMTFSNMHLYKFNREQRNQLLDTMLRYYQIHNSTLGNLKSPDILSTLFV